MDKTAKIPVKAFYGDNLVSFELFDKNKTSKKVVGQFE